MIDHRTGIDKITLTKPALGGSMLHSQDLFYKIIGGIMRSKLFVNIVLCIGLILILSNSSRADPAIRCCGLPFERLEYGSAITENGIMFADFGAGPFLIYEHIPFAEEDIRLVAHGYNILRLCDIQNSNNFALYNGDNYEIYNYKDDFILEPTLSINISSRHVRIIEWDSYYIFIEFDEETFFSDRHLKAIYKYGTDNTLSDITMEVLSNLEDVTHIKFSNGKYYFVTEMGITKTDGEGNSEFTPFYEGQALNSLDWFIVRDERMFARHDNARFLSELVINNDFIEYSNSREFIGGIAGVFFIEGQVIVSTRSSYIDNYESDAWLDEFFLRQLYDWFTGEIITGCENARYYTKIGDTLYGFKDQEILLPY